jgi:tRNA pseudouridine55 synthase
MFGVLAVDKPMGMTSRWAVGRIEKVLRPLRVGHTGTLDPLATGVLLLAVGSATRLVEFSHLQSKSYEADFLLGHISSTLDTEGEVKPLMAAPCLTQEQVANAAQGLLGVTEQTPPKFSAVHIDGQRAYDLARKGKEFDIPSRQIQVHGISVLQFEYPRVTLEIRCGTGTYIRTLGSDIARSLGSDAVMTRLVRTRIGRVELSQCVQLDAMKTADDIRPHLLSPVELVKSLETVTLSDAAAIQIRHGIPIELEVESDGPIAAIDAFGEIVAVVKRSGKLYRSLRVFQKTSDVHHPSSNKIPQSPES